MATNHLRVFFAKLLYKIFLFWLPKSTKISFFRAENLLFCLLKSTNLLFFKKSTFTFFLFERGMVGLNSFSHLNWPFVSLCSPIKHYEDMPIAKTCCNIGLVLSSPIWKRFPSDFLPSFALFLQYLNVIRWS